MTEQEYIDATNLAKVRAAIGVVREIHPTDSHAQEGCRQAMWWLRLLEERYTGAVKVEGE